MMALFRSFVLLAMLAGGAVASSSIPKNPLVTPVQKVITLIETMKDKAETEGENEAKTYGEFSCFCKKTTKEKSKKLVDGRDLVLSLSASIESDTASKNEDSAELDQREIKQEKSKALRAQNKNECAAKESEYTAKEADVSKGIYGLTNAIESMENTKPKASLLQTGISTDLTDIVAMAAAMGMVKTAKYKVVADFLQGKGNTAFLQQKAAVDPTNPTYEYHSDDIISLCKDLKTDFESQKKRLDDDWNATDTSCKELDSTLKGQIEKNDRAMKALKKAIDGLEEKLSKDLGTLEVTRGMMVEDKAYLKDLTKQCEDSAADFDQRAALRKSEIDTLTEALSILKDKVQPTDEKANERALVQERAKGIVNAGKGLPKKAMVRAISFLQASHSQSAQSRRSGASLSAEARKQLAVVTLQKQGHRLNSVALQSLTAQIRADPFMKVKELIQKLIERLVAEAAAESEKKGFCDTEVSKAKHDRDYRYNDVMSLSAELAELEAERDSLKAEIKALTSEISDLKKALAEATKLRDDDKRENLDIIDTAQSGLAALKECIEILETFYRVSARATVLAQVSPVDEDTTGAGFEGAYKGQQTRSVAILEMLDDIKSDYERTIKTRTAQEAEAHAAFVEFKRSSESDISGKGKKLELDEEDLQTTLSTIVSKMGDLKTNMDLLDKALLRLVDLNPTCVDSGMSYSDRTDTREAEIAALKTALCQLDPECKDDL